MRHCTKLQRWAVVLMMAAMLGLSWPCAAEVWTVTSTGDDGPGTLRAALASAADGDTIDFALTLPAVISLTSGALNVVKDVMITGPGQDQVTLDGMNNYDESGSPAQVFVITSGVTATISGLTISNVCSYYCGGGVLNWGTLSLSDCTLSGNYAREGGGGVYSGGSLSLIRCTLTGNAAGFTEDDDGGGAVAFIPDYAAATLTVENSTLSNNTAPSGGGISIVVYGNTNGPAHASVNVVNSTLNDNNAYDYYGGAVAIEVNEYCSINVVVEGCTLNGNSALSGGAICSISSEADVSVTVGNSILNDNVATAMGGAIAYADFPGEAAMPGSGFTLTNCTLSNNAAYSTDGNWLQGGMGGAIFNMGVLALTDCWLTHNTALEAAGAIFSGIPYGNGESVALTVTGSVLSGNTVTGAGDDFNSGMGGGGAICNWGSGITASATIEDSILTGNVARFGGALLNYAYTDSDGEWSIGPAGTATVNLVNSTLSDNLASADSDAAFGGAIAQMCLGDSASSAALTVNGSTLNGNEAVSGMMAIGGAICSLGQTLMGVSLGNSTLADNSVVGPTGIADASGGAIGLWGGVLTVDNCTLSGNFCKAQDGSAADGASSIVNGWGEVGVKNSILANDAASPNLSVMDASSTILSYGHNLCNDDGGGFLTAEGDLVNTAPMLGPLQDNGGPTWTCALLPGSPAIDMADATDSKGCLVEFDQREVARPQGAANDIGAFEAELVIPPSSSLNISEATPDRRGVTVFANVFITNLSDTDAENVRVNTARLGEAYTAMELPRIYDTLKSGASRKCTLMFQDVPSGETTLEIEGTCSLGDFFTVQTVIVP